MTPAMEKFLTHPSGSELDTSDINNFVTKRDAQLATKEIHRKWMEIVRNSKISSFATNLFDR